jgi:phage repressor protein C with HTH and peptisase S24 domain
MDTSTLKSHISRRLKSLRDAHFDRSGSKMAKAIGKSQSSVNRVLNQQPKGIDPYLEVAQSVATVLDVPVKEITQAESAPPTASQQVEMAQILSVQNVTVGGENAPAEEWKTEKIPIPKEALGKLVTGDVPPDVGVVEVKGQGMYPEIQCGDWLLFSFIDHIADGGTYLIQLDDAVLVRLIQRMAGRRLRIHSLNSRFSDDMIRKSEQGNWVTDDDGQHRVHFDVVGRFLGVLQPKDLFRASQRVHDLVEAYTAMKQNGELE